MSANIIVYSKDEIKQRITETFKNYGYNVSAPGTPLYLLINDIAEDFSDLSTNISSVIQNSGQTAAGDALTGFTSFFGMTRDHATFAYAADNNVKFSVPGAAIDLTIPKDTVLYSEDESVAYRVAFDTTILYTEQPVVVIANKPGSTYNVKAGELTKHTLNKVPAFAAIADSITVINTAPIENGVDILSDEELSAKSKSIMSMPSSREMLYTLLHAEPDIEDASVDNVERTAGIFSVYVSPTEAVITPVLYARIKNIIDYCITGTQPAIYHPKYRHVSLKLCTNASSNDYTLIRKAIVEFINRKENRLSLNLRELTGHINNQFEESISADVTHLSLSDYNPINGVIFNTRTVHTGNQVLPEGESFFTTDDENYIVIGDYK